MTPDVVVGLVCEASAHERRDRLVATIEAAGAVVEPCNETNVLGNTSAVDAIVLDLAGDARILVAAAALAGDARARWIPRVIIVEPDASAEQLASLGPAWIVPSSASPETVARAVADTIEHVRARQESERRLDAENDELRATEQRFTELQQAGATLSHDARVLFGVILGFASNLRDDIAGPITEVQRQHIMNIIEASNGASSLVDRHVTALRATARRSASAASRVLGARQAARRRQHELGELIRPVVALFEGIASAKAIHLRAVVEHPVMSWCDAMQIKQALVNLLANALKFTPPGGSVEVVAKVGPPASSRGGATERRDVEIVVTDSGPGIPVEERERVFERGVRLERDLMSSGTGIGLAVVRDVVELHGGTVFVEDAPGGGASFVLAFPADLRVRAGERVAAAGVSPADSE